VTIDGDWIDELDLLTTCTRHSELQVIIALSLISTLQKSLHTKSFPACSVSNSPSLATPSNSRVSSASRAHVVTVQEYAATKLSLLGSSFYSLGADPTENTAPSSPSINVMDDYPAKARISFPEERVYRAVAQKWQFVYSPIIQQRLCSFVSRSLLSNEPVRHNIILTSIHFLTITSMPS
jgi:hypothetical protein